ncbi:MAG: peptidoglycan DD-metalloendopeptidase family protein [Pseudohongiellaceae bacterium]
MDIRGRIGDPVRSTADGIVVYAGGGLRGYGKLVIVKHNERYLSAYGHNQSILVQEGDEVKGGQIVARIGGPNGDKDLLHFEIRQDGKPEDPLHYLPALGQDSQAGR